ncbi:MAG: glycosyltransferase [Erythrobacter sp.]|jgi:succinoglycan biosynthesis protein ExoO|nr:glycosyltransferase [Erythrobacter sp.]
MTDVLIVSRQRLSGAHDGSSAYLLQIARALREAGCAVHLLQPSPSVMGRRPVLRLSDAMRVFESHRIRGVLKLGRLLVSTNPRAYLAAARGVLAGFARRAGFTGRWTEDRPLPHAIAIGWNAADRRFVARHGADRCDFVVADYMFQAEAFEALPVPRSRCAILMHDLFHARSPGADRDTVASVSREAEIAMLAKAGTVIAIQAEEAEFVRRTVRSPRVILAPMAAEPSTATALPGEDGRVLFVGSRTAPNTQGLRWFLGEVWPIVRARYPAAVLDVVGTVSDDLRDDRSAGLRVHGKVERLEPFYERAGVVISPLRFGSGLKIKLIEAMGWGKAIVATGVTLQGVTAECKDAVARADDPADFSEALLGLIGDEAGRTQIGNRALAAAHAAFGPASAHGELLDWLARERPSARREAGAQTRAHPA